MGMVGHAPLPGGDVQQRGLELGVVVPQREVDVRFAHLGRVYVDRLARLVRCVWIGW